MVSLLKCVSCSILHSSARHGLNEQSNIKIKNKNKNKNNSKFFILTLFFAIWSLMTLAGLTLAHGAAVYSNADIYVKPTFEQICNPQEEHFIESDGKESSLIVELNSNVLIDNRKSCTRILSAPSNYGFIVRLILPKMRRNHHNTAKTTNNFNENDSEKPRKAVTSALNEMTTLIEKLNATALKTILGRTCPLSVFSSQDPHTPQWRVDPCQLEDTAPEMEDPVRLFRGRVKIVWEHSNQRLNSKLMITALGKGEQCRSENKHPCLKIGDEPLLCISKALVCDGIRHCPNSNEYDTDEDYSVCWKRRHLGEALPTAIETDLFEHFALEVFRNLFLFDVPTMSSDVLSKKEQQSKKSKSAVAVAPAPAPLLPQPLNVTTLRKVTQNAVNDTDKQLVADKDDDNETLFVDLMDNSTDKSTTQHRRNNTRHGLHSDLSKYGPWGYLMLGMLLCGGALLICGLWASASQQAANNEREAALASAGAANGISIDHSSVATSPPNYEELDPPPAYSVLFPNQKSASSATLTAMDAIGPTTTTPLSPSSRPACSGTAGLALRTTTAQVVITPATPTSPPTTTTTTTAANNNTVLDSQIPN